jgi:hypothetical protein
MPNLPTFSREEPYYTFDKQRFMHEGNTSLGVNGTLHIIPELEAFRIEGIVTDVEGNIIPNAIINIYDENNTKLFTTLNVDLLDLPVTNLRRKPHRYHLIFAIHSPTFSHTHPHKQVL